MSILIRCFNLGEQYMLNKLFPIVLATSLLTTVSVNASPQITSHEPKSLSVQILKDRLELTKKSFQSIQLLKQSDGAYAIQIELTPEAANQMHQITSDNVNRTASIVWNGLVLNSPTIRSPIASKFQITGLTKQQAKTIVQAMQSE